MDPYFNLSELEKKLRKIIEEYYALRSVGGKVISFPSGKGGVGKTSIVVNLAAALALKGKKVAIVDLNLALPNVSLFIENMPEKTVTHFLCGEAKLSETSAKLSVKKAEIDVYPAESIVDLKKKIKIERIGDLALELKPMYDYILFDQSPGLSKFAVYPTLVADVVFVVSADIKPAYLDAIKVRDVLESSGVNFNGFVVNMAKRKNLKYFYNERVYATIPYDWRLKNAFSSGKTVFQLRFGFLSSSRRAFSNFAKKLIEDFPPERE